MLGTDPTIHERAFARNLVRGLANRRRPVGARSYFSRKGRKKADVEEPRNRTGGRRGKKNRDKPINRRKSSFSKASLPAGLRGGGGKSFRHLLEKKKPRTVRLRPQKKIRSTAQGSRPME